MAVGIICEYNPFHNGHLYHLNKVKEMFKDEEIILVTNAYFTQRGDISVINKWDKKKLCLSLGINLIIELPFVFASQSADVFAYGAINILNELKIDKIVFGVETYDLDLLKKISILSLNDLKKYLDKGLSYPDSISKLIEEKLHFKLQSPNDILGVCYLREINKLNNTITPYIIKRTTDYNSSTLDTICSATSIRKAIKEQKDISHTIPYNQKIITPSFLDDYFHILKYKILTSNDLDKYQTVDEGIEYRLKKCMLISNNLDDFISRVKTKRYTYNKIKRMLVHILCNFTKEEARDLKIEYIRVLGFDNRGQNYLNKIKKSVNVPLITKYEKYKNLDIEIRSTCAYVSILDSNDLIMEEYKNIPKN